MRHDLAGMGIHHTPTLNIFIGADAMIVFAHRGLSSEYPENTELSFRKAIEAGAQAIELDVIMNPDRHFYISHDFIIRNETQILDLRQASSEEIDAFRLPPRFRGEKIPALAGLLNWLPSGIFLNIELKISRKENVADICDAFLETLEPWRNRYSSFLISSFHLPALRRIQKRLPIKTAFLLEAGRAGLPARIYLRLTGAKTDYVHIHHSMNTKRWLRDSRFGGVGVYTVNDIETARQLQKCGVYGIFSDHCDRMIHALEVEKDPV